MELPVQQFRTKGEQAYLDMFDQARDALPGARDPFVSGLRTKAIEAYARLGLPHRRIEAWKYTDLRSRLTDTFPLLSAAGVAVGDGDLSRALGSALAALPAYRLVVVEGDLRADLSDLSALKSAGVEVLSLARGLEKPPSWLKKVLGQVNPRDDDAVLALNTALMTGGVVLRIGEGVTLDKSSTSSSSTGRASRPRPSRGMSWWPSRAVPSLCSKAMAALVFGACSAMRSPSLASATRPRSGTSNCSVTVRTRFILRPGW